MVQNLRPGGTRDGVVNWLMAVAALSGLGLRLEYRLRPARLIWSLGVPGAILAIYANTSLPLPLTDHAAVFGAIALAGFYRIVRTMAGPDPDILARFGHPADRAFAGFLREAALAFLLFGAAALIVANRAGVDIALLHLLAASLTFCAFSGAVGLLLRAAPGADLAVPATAALALAAAFSHGPLPPFVHALAAPPAPGALAPLLAVAHWAMAAFVLAQWCAPLPEGSDPEAAS